MLRRAAAAHQLADRELRQPGLGTASGAPTLSSRWAPSPGPPGFSRPHDRPPVRSSSLRVDDSGMDRFHSMRHGPLPEEYHNAEEPCRLLPIGAAVRAARPLSAAPYVALEERRLSHRDRPSSPRRQGPFHDAPPWDMPYSLERQDSFQHAPSWDRPYPPERQDSLHQADRGGGLTGRDGGRSSRPWDEPRSSLGPQDGQGRSDSRHEDDLPPPPLPPPPPTTAARGSPQVSQPVTQEQHAVYRLCLQLLSAVSLKNPSMVSS